ncbi:MAG: response regulator [Campylobacterota bacterium]|nr:response regulator [Campylobacterota bacterium]
MANKKILIVDDVKSNIDILMQFLKKSYDLIPALSGEKALKIVQKIDVDAVLLDIMMPEMDGYEVCKALKSLDRTKEIPVVFITAKADEKSIQEAHKVGGVDFISKPFEEKEILNIISKYL